MSEQLTVHFQGTITTVTPYATSPAGLRRPKNAPLPLPRMGDKPYVPGPGLRGTLRRKATDAVRTILSGDGSPVFTVDDHYFNVLGGIKGGGKEDKADLVGAEKRRIGNPIMGLFGAGDPWASGRLFVGHGIPTTAKVDVIRGARIDDFARDGSKLQILSPEEQQRWLVLAEANAERSRLESEAEGIDAKLKSDATPEADRKALAARSKTIEARLKEIAASGYDVSINRPLDGYEVIPPGTVMNHTMTLTFGRRYELGLLLSALRYWALDPYVGAHKAHGCGLLSAGWTVSVREGYAPTFSELGKVAVEPFTTLDLSGVGLLAEYEAEFVTALEKAPENFDFTYPKKAA